MTDDRVTPGKLRTALADPERALRTRICPRCGEMSTMHVRRGVRRCLECRADYYLKREGGP